MADKSQTCNIQFFPRLSGKCLPLCHQCRISQASSALSCPGGQSQSGCSTGVSGTPALFLQCCAAEGKHLFPRHQSCWSLASKPGKDFYNLCPTTFASILVLQTHGISQTQFRALFLHSSVSPYETTPQLKAKQRKKKHPGRKKHLQYLKAVSFIPTAYVVLSNHL